MVAGRKLDLADPDPLPDVERATLFRMSDETAVDADEGRTSRPGRVTQPCGREAARSTVRSDDPIGPSSSRPRHRRGGTASIRTFPSAPTRALLGVGTPGGVSALPEDAGRPTAERDGGRIAARLSTSLVARFQASRR
jgi:hypothetical protein